MVESDGLLNRCRLNPYLGFESRSLRLRRFARGGLFVCLILLSVSAGAQTPAAQYRALLKHSSPDPRLSLELVKRSPGDYAGKTFEFRGIFRGYGGFSCGGSGRFISSDQPSRSSSLA